MLHDRQSAGPMKRRAIEIGAATVERTTRGRYESGETRSWGSEKEARSEAEAASGTRTRKQDRREGRIARATATGPGQTTMTPHIP